MVAVANYFQQHHQRLDAMLHAHLLALVGGDFASALQHLQQWWEVLRQHIDIENTHLLPHIAPGVRWSERVYRLEHERIELLAQEHLARMQAASAAPTPSNEGQRCERILALLDAVHALRHVLEHHHAREEQALAVELPAELQQRAFS